MFCQGHSCTAKKTTRVSSLSLKTYSSLSCPVKCSLRPVAFSTWLNFCCQKKPASWVWSKQVEWCPTFNWHQSDWLQARRYIWGQLGFVPINFLQKSTVFWIFFVKLWVAIVLFLFYDFNPFEIKSPINFNTIPTDLLVVEHRNKSNDGLMIRRSKYPIFSLSWWFSMHFVQTWNQWKPWTQNWP